MLTLLAGIALLAAADYWLELPLAAAAGGHCGASSSARSRWRSAWRAVGPPLAAAGDGGDHRTGLPAARPADSHDGAIQRAVGRTRSSTKGVATTLVTALEDDTVRRAQPLPLDAVMPWKSLAVASLLAAVVGLGLAGLSAFDWQWRAAAKRAFSADEPYTGSRSIRATSR